MLAASYIPQILKQIIVNWKWYTAKYYQLHLYYELLYPVYFTLLLLITETTYLNEHDFLIRILYKNCY